MWIFVDNFSLKTRHGTPTILLVAATGVDTRCMPIMVHPTIGLHQHNLRTCQCTCMVVMCSLRPCVGAGRAKYNSCVGTPTSARGLSHVGQVPAPSTSVLDSLSYLFRQNPYCISILCKTPFRLEPWSLTCGSTTAVVKSVEKWLTVLKVTWRHPCPAW